MTSPRPLVVGHRGASGYRPEHTRAAYELAFALGADAVEPDIVATKDGELVLRHENEISGTTDVAQHPEFASRRTTKVVDGTTITGWFTEDFTWAELSTLRAIERLPQLRQHSATFDGRYPILRLRDLLELIDAESERHGRTLGLVAEVKHATHFAAHRTFHSASWSPTRSPTGRMPNGSSSRASSSRCSAWFANAASRPGTSTCSRRRGRPRISWRGSGRQAPSYTAQLSDAGLAKLAAEVDGISVDRSRLLKVAGGAAVATDLVSRAHASGLSVFAWTLRPENRFLTPPFRRGSKAADWGDWRGEFRMLSGRRPGRRLLRPPGSRRRGPRRRLRRLPAVVRAGAASGVAPRIGRP